MDKSSKILKLEWRRTKQESPRIAKAIREIRVNLKKKNVDIIYIEKPISGSGSSEILFNDMPLEFLLDEARVRENFCGTCSTPEERKKKLETISGELIKKAALKAAGLI